MRVVRENPDMDVEDLAGELEELWCYESFPPGQLEFEKTDHGDQLAIQYPDAYYPRARVQEAINRRG